MSQANHPSLIPSRALASAQQSIRGIHRRHIIGVAIDPAKSFHKVLIFDFQPRVIEGPFDIDVRRHGWEKLVSAIERAKKRRAAQRLVIGLEASGAYSWNLSRELLTLSPHVYFFNPLAVATARKQKLLLGRKTDAIDTAVIADLLLRGQGNLVRTPEPAYLALRERTYWRHQKTHLVTELKQQLVDRFEKLYPGFTLQADGHKRLISEVNRSSLARAIIELGRTSSFVRHRCATDFYDRLTLYANAQTGAVASYSYNGLGQRIGKTVNGVTTQAYHAGSEVVLDSVGTSYVYSQNLDEYLTIQRGTTIQFAHQDGLGNVIAVTDLNGNIMRATAYAPFGAIRKETGSALTTAGFTGAPLDQESGLQFLRNRSYDPRPGSFTTEDPIGTQGDPHRYRYAWNSPSHFTDPFGLRVQIGGRPVPHTPGQHTVIVVTPDDGGPVFWLSAEPEHQPTATNPNFGRLIGYLNDPNDAPANLSNLTDIEDPQNRSDKQLINAIVQAAGRYHNNLPYWPVPSGMAGFYNSNSYTAGIIEAAGGVVPKLPGLQPGIEKPIPLGRNPQVGEIDPCTANGRFACTQ